MDILPDGGPTVEKITRAHLNLKPDDAEELGKLEPGMGVRIVLIGEVQHISKSKLEDGKEYDGGLDLTVKEMKLVRQKNAFMELAEDD